MSKIKKRIIFLVPMHISWDNFSLPGYVDSAIKTKDGKFINPPRTDLPLGPLSISSYLKKYIEIDVKLIDFNAEVNALEKMPFNSFFEICNHYLEKNRNYKPYIVGVSSLFSPSFENFMDCGKLARIIWPNAVIVGGGHIPSNSYKYIYDNLDCVDYDALCFGEGEKPMLGLLNAENPYEYIENNPAWITRSKVKNKKDFLPQHDFITDLDEIPFYDYDLCDLNKHDCNILASTYSSEKKRGFHVMTSRGCPFHCTFCASHRIHGRSMRYHSLNRIENDFARLVSNYDADTIIFQDDHLMASKDRVYKILEIVKKYGLESIYQNGLTLYSLDRPMLEAFRSVGVRHLVLPVESGSERVLRECMKKPLKMEISERVARDCRDLGIYTNTNILLGMPGETILDLEVGRQNLKRIQTNWFNIVSASPLVGSEMHEISVRKGYIAENQFGSDYKYSVLSTEEFNAEFLQEYKYFLNLDLNFANNTDMRLKEYELAKRGFLNVLSIREDHAFAHYALACCYEKTNDFTLSKKHYVQYLKNIREDFWNRWAWVFGLKDVDAGNWSIDDFENLECIFKSGKIRSEAFFGHGLDFA
ncbi:MAG: radical SAM protein [Lamprobacter sp.]|uniref:B12-binding domain-containing radical SAM protein n=1 Tax=Lamprobacter sp. TaxID=3100796 RepID=UPI002B262184|nr:radical SAM protein [Lamprobacter sp.]MEA3641492.1 radical SAM protein [Lamprobacter sp.]